MVGSVEQIYTETLGWREAQEGRAMSDNPKCPSCGNPKPRKTQEMQCLYRCDKCDCDFTQWQQEEIERLQELLKVIEPGPLSAVWALQAECNNLVAEIDRLRENLRKIAEHPMALSDIIAIARRGLGDK
jgi:ribosomal protein L37AE/L43A